MKRPLRLVVFTLSMVASVLVCGQCAVAVDMGLSVRWAKCNVGADKPEEFGDYYAWGETTPKRDYCWTNYNLCKGSSTKLTKYCTSSKYGRVDDKTVLEPEDDAARAKKGKKWRMPTDEEWTELRDTSNCSWVWTERNGVKGYLVTSKKPGYTNKSIFLPAAGYRNDMDLIAVGHYGIYWSSTLNTRYPRNAYRVDFVPDSIGRYHFRRCYGRTVRPVLNK